MIAGGLVEGSAGYRGIKTPGLHLMSSSPKGWEPRMYCKGFPLLLEIQRRLRR